MAGGQNKGRYQARTRRILKALAAGEHEVAIARREGVSRQWVRWVGERQTPVVQFRPVTVERMQQYLNEIGQEERQNLCTRSSEND